MKSSTLDRVVESPALSLPYSHITSRWKLNTAHAVRVAKFDAHKMANSALPDSSTDPNYWFSRCAGECATHVLTSANTIHKRFLLHYIQFEYGTPQDANVTCSCFAGPTPEIPSNAELSHFLTERGDMTTEEDVTIWSVGHPTSKQQPSHEHTRQRMPWHTYLQRGP